MATPPGIEHKSYTFKATLEDNVIKGGPAAIGNMDQGGDVIFPGAFKGVLPDFLKNGFVAFAHEWDDLPIAMPLVAQEQGNILYSEAKFHSTQAAQDARTVAKERLDNNLTVGLSIGYTCTEEGTHVFESGQDMLDWAKGVGMDVKLLDTKGIADCDCWCRAITQFGELYEWSIVPVPMNRMAGAVSVKSWIPEEKTACGSTGLPIAARDCAWDASAADKRVRSWAGAEDAPNAKYRSAFFWYDSANADQWGSYHLGFADVINGALTCIPRGVFAAAGAIQGARGADGSKYADAKPKIARYYARFRSEFNDDTIVVPWGKALPQTERDFEAFLRETGFSKSQAVACTNHGFKALLRDAESDGAGNKQDETETPLSPAGEILVEVKTVDVPPAPNVDPPTLTPLEEELQRVKQRVARALHQRFRALDAKVAASLSRTAGAKQ